MALLFLSTLSVTTAVGVTAIHVYPKDDDTYEFYVTWLSRRPFFRSILAASLSKFATRLPLAASSFVAFILAGSQVILFVE